MVKGPDASKRPGGWAMIEVAVALAIFIVALVPLAFSFLSEFELCRAYYYRAVAMEVVDGEMEILAAGEYRQFQPGTFPYRSRAAAADGLPGQLILTVEKDRLRLEWAPDRRGQGGRVVREVKLR